MQLATLIEPDEAAERLKAYAGQIAEERTVEDEAVKAGLRAAARGLPVISLPDVVAAGGWFDNGLPRLGISRADATTCQVSVSALYDRHAPGEQTRTRVTYCDEPWDRGRARVGRHRVELVIPSHPDRSKRGWHNGRTIVPTIPPHLRPRRQRLWRFHVLWEVERWDPTPPVDPALLRHIRGDLWSVVATWDLTPLERAVLTGRA